MKRKFKISLLLSLMSVMSLFIFTGCKLGVTKQELLDRYDLTSCITYYVNADKATFEPIKATERKIYYKTGQVPYDIPDYKISYENHDFEGWYEIECDKDGNPIPEKDFVDKDGKVTHSAYTLTTEKADFTKPMEEGEHRYYAAKWVTRTKVKVKIVLDDVNGKVPLDKEGISGAYFSPLEGKEEVSHLDEILSFSYDGSSGALATISDDLLPVKDKAYTFVAYYADEACKTPVQWPIQEQEEDVYLYAKYITGKWTVLDSSSDVRQMINQSGSSSARFYLACDLDCSTLTVSPMAKFACELQGNGFKIKGLTVNRANNDTKKTSIFGQITETAIINNVTFEDLTFKCNFNQNPDMQDYYYLFNSLSASAEIENVTISGSMLMYNYDRDDVLLTNVKEGINYVFGGYTTDQEYLTQSQGKGFIFAELPKVETDLKSYA